jgi:hypothetical protein
MTRVSYRCPGNLLCLPFRLRPSTGVCPSIRGTMVQLAGTATQQPKRAEPKKNPYWVTFSQSRPSCWPPFPFFSTNPVSVHPQKCQLAAWILRAYSNYRKDIQRCLRIGMIYFQQSATKPGRAALCQFAITFCR